MKIYKIGLMMMVLGAIIAWSGTIVSIGFGLYNWSHGVELSVSIYGSFILWLKMVIGGLLVLFAGVLIDRHGETIT